MGMMDEDKWVEDFIKTLKETDTNLRSDEEYDAFARQMFHMARLKGLEMSNIAVEGEPDFQEEYNDEIDHT